MSQLDPLNINVDLYRGDKHLVLILETTSLEALTELSGCVLKLSDNRVEEVRLGQLQFTNLISGVHDVILHLIRNGPEPSKCVKLATHHPGGPVIHWSRHAEGWLETADLLDALKSGPGHQYLSRGVDDDVEIVFSFREGLTKRS